MKNLKSRWINGLVSGAAMLATLSAAFASVPKNVTNDTALYQRLSEIEVKREKELNFDRDIANLASSEGRYREKLPGLSGHPRLSGPMKRIGQKSYRYSGGETRGRAARR